MQLVGVRGRDRLFASQLLHQPVEVVAILREIHALAVGGPIVKRRQGNRPAAVSLQRVAGPSWRSLHNRTANCQRVDFSQDCDYLDRLVKKLRSKQTIASAHADELHWLRDRWREAAAHVEDRQVVTHGDATPSNFLFGDGLSVMAIDLERMKSADRVFDVGESPESCSISS